MDLDPKLSERPWRKRPWRTKFKSSHNAINRGNLQYVMGFIRGFPMNSSSIHSLSFHGALNLIVQTTSVVCTQALVIINFDTNGEHKQHTKWGIPLILHFIDCTNTHCLLFITILKPRSILNCLHRYTNCLSSHTDISSIVCQLSAQAQIIHHHTRKIMFFVTMYQLTIVLQAWFDLLEKGLNHRQYRSTLTVNKQ